MSHASFSHNSRQRSPLLQLPTELRLQIYADLSQLPASEYQYRSTIDEDPWSRAIRNSNIGKLLALLQTCGELRTEVRDFIYAQTGLTIMIQSFDEQQIQDRLAKEEARDFPSFPDVRFLKMSRHLQLRGGRAGGCCLYSTGSRNFQRYMMAMLDRPTAEPLERFRLVIFSWPSKIS